MSRTVNRPYTDKARRIDKTCRNHGADSWSVEDRTHFDRRNRLHADMKLREYKVDI